MCFGNSWKQVCFPLNFPLYTTFALWRSQYCGCELSRAEVFELNQLVLLMLSSHHDPVIWSRTVCYCVRLRSNTHTHTHAYITSSHLHFVHCVWHHLVSTVRTLPRRPVNSVSLVTWMQQHLCFINNNTRCVVFHVVLYVSVCWCACVRVFVQDHVALMMCTHPECCNLRELLLSYSWDGWQLY